MAAVSGNKIQIKRSIANSVVTGLSNGELAFTANGKIFYIGDPNDGSSIRIGGEMIPGTLTANQALVANATSEIDKIKVANAVITNIWANGASGSNGQVLVSNGSAIYWGTGTSGSNTYVQFNDSGVANGVAGFAFDKVSNTLLVSNTVNAAIFTIGTSLNVNSTNLVFTTGGITANAFFGNGASITSVDAYTIGGNTVNDIVDNAQANIYANSATYTGNNDFSNGTTFSSNVTISGYLNSNVVPQANNTHDLGSSSLRWANVYSLEVIANNGAFDGNLTVSGDLTVSGNVTTIDVQSIKVGDPLIYLAGNNDTTDTLDIGFVGQYYKDGEIRNAGLFRDHSDDVFKLFRNALFDDLDGNNNIDTTTLEYRIATLQTYLDSGALTSNNDTVTITANATVNVNITANTLVLSSPLLGNSGGTGLSSYSNNDLLVANNTNGFKTLSFSTTIGHVLQSNGTALVYDILDGGTF